VKSLSGGERNRLLLARLFTRPSNVLVLDEPTNDLDIETLELLEELLAQYDGTLFLVSHDRAFLDNVVTQVIAFEGDGKLMEYAGGFEDWVRVKKFQSSQKAAVTAPAKPAAKAPEEKSKAASKRSFKEQKELDEMPQRIEVLEREQEDITAALGSGTLFRDKSVPCQATATASGRDRARAVETDGTLGGAGKTGRVGTFHVPTRRLKCAYRVGRANG